MSSEKEGMYSTPEAATALASNFSLEDSEVSSTHQRRIDREKQAAAEQELEVLFLERSIREAKLQNLRRQLEDEVVGRDFNTGSRSQRKQSRAVAQRHQKKLRSGRHHRSSGSRPYSVDRLLKG